MFDNTKAPIAQTIGVIAITSLKASSSFRRKVYYLEMNIGYCDQKEEDSISQFIKEAVTSIHKGCTLLILSNNIRDQWSWDIEHDSQTNSLDGWAQEDDPTHSFGFCKELKGE